MIVDVLFFAQMRDAMGVDSVRMDVERGTTVAQLAARLLETPELAHVRGLPLRYAVGDVFVTADQELGDGEQMAIIPPVSGG